MTSPTVTKYNLLVLGEKSVGKTSLILRFCEGVFDESYITTLGVDLKKHVLTLNGQKVQLQIWDTAGQERYRTITPNYYRQAAGIVLIYDLSRADTFQLINTWLRGIDENAGSEVELILIGNKSDLDSKREVPRQAAATLAEQLDIPFFETSARYGTNVEEAFRVLAERVHGKQSTAPSGDMPSPNSFQVPLDRENEDESGKKKKKCC
eukprot:Platyproteum_vivax@DN4311_c0_g1_i1.p1